MRTINCLLSKITHRKQNMINTDEWNTWPTNLYEEALKICDELNLKKRVNVDANEVNFFDQARSVLRRYINPYDTEIYAKFSSLAKEENILCHHFTRLLNRNTVRKNGLKCNTWENYSVHIRNTLIKCKLSTAEINHALYKLKNIYDNKYDELFAPGHDVNFTTSSLDIHASLYCNIVGGELAKDAFENDIKLFDRLKKIGHPYRVDFCLKISELDDYDSDIYILLICELSNILWGKKYPIAIDEIVRRDILSSEIIDVVEINDDF